MTRVAARSQLTAAEYLAWEREQVDKHEFHAGEVFAMAGGNPHHNKNTKNKQNTQKHKHKNQNITFTSDQRIVFGDGVRYVYPDASVVCGPVIVQDGTSDVLDNPTILIEELSRGTEQNDRGL